MHELYLVSSLLTILEDLAKENRAKSIKDVFVKVGSFSCVNPETFQFAFDTMKEKVDVVKDAVLHVRETPSSDEILLERVEMEV